MIRKTVILILLFLSSTFLVVGQNAETVLQKVSEKLLSLKTIKYKFTRELNYASEGYLAKSEADSFIDFTTDDNLPKAKYQFSADNYLMVFNGSQLFTLDKKAKTIEVNNKPSESDLIASSFLGNTPITFKQLFPQLIKNNAIKKSLSETPADFVIEFELENMAFDKLGKISMAELKNKHIFSIKIDKESLLPTEVLQKLNQTDFIKTNLSEIVVASASPAENSWYYSTYLKDYQYAKKPEDRLIKIGEAAYEIRLPKFGTNKTVSLNDYKGKIVLLEFWIFHCGYCQAAVPKLNALQQKYKDKNLQILAVNIADSDNQLQFFKEKLNPEYPIIYQGEAIAKQYGVWFYPTIVLIGKDGKVIYSGEFDTTKIEDLINHNL